LILIGMAVEIGIMRKKLNNTTKKPTEMKHISEIPVLSNPKINDVLIIHDGSKLKMQMNHTAIDWLAEQMLWNEFHNPYLEKAKEMEKEQMIEFANSFYDNCGLQYGGLEKSSEEYYNETYGKDA